MEFEGMQQSAPLEANASNPVFIEEALPDGLMSDSTISASSTILAAAWHEIAPINTDTFSYDFNDTIEFKLADSVNIIDNSRTYLRFTLNITIEGTDSVYAFDVGGANGLFRQITLTKTNGDTEIRNHQHWNRDFIRRSMLLQTDEEVARDGPKYGDDITETWVDSASSLTPLLHENNTGTTATGRYVGLGSKAVVNGRMTQPGDYITTPAEGVVGRIGGIFASGDRASVIGGNSNALVSTIMNGGSRGSARQKYCNVQQSTSLSNEIIFTEYDDYGLRAFPLFMINGGVRKRYVLEHPSRAFVNLRPYYAGQDEKEPANLDYGITYTITNPRLMVYLVTLHPTARSSLKRAFDSDRGLQIRLRSTRVISHTTSGGGGGTSEAISIHPGTRAARGVMIQFQDSESCFGTGRRALRNHSLSMGLLSGITEYYYQVGALRIPWTPFEPKTTYESGQLYHQMLLYGERWMRKNGTPRIKQGDFEPTYPHIGNVTGDAAYVKVLEARHAYYCIDFSRAGEDNFGYLCGIDLTAAQSHFKIKRDGAKSSHTDAYAHGGGGVFTGNQVVNFFIDHDSLLILSSSKGLILAD